jgi:hyperosmotically inducible protein
MSIRTALALALTAALATPAAADASGRGTLQLLNDISKQVITYPWFTVFDDVNASIDNGVVTLTGKVTMPYKRAAIEKRVATVAGVREVHNRIETLPVSSFDDDLRRLVARAIYGHPALWTYATRLDPPIRIVVDRGHVTLTGVVDNDVDRTIVRSLASQTLAYSVTCELKTAAEARLERAAIS